jgi:hypothetical protein
VLTASGLIAGEALCGLVVAAFRAVEKSKGHDILPSLFKEAPRLRDITAIIFFIAIAVLMIRLPLANAGSPDEPAPPTAIM